MKQLARACCGTALLALAAAASVAATDGSRFNAFVYHEYGSPSVLKWAALPMPEPGAGQVLIRIRAAGLNPLDWHYLRGKPYLMRLAGIGLLAPDVPRLGADVAGEVVSVGPDVGTFRPGDAVFGVCQGAFAEFCLASSKRIVQKPANISFEQAAAVPIAALTALQGLRDKGNLQPGQTVLVNGASGGVGTFAVQIARALGANVTGVCSARNVELVRSLGASTVIDYTETDFTRTGQRYDLILDMVGNHSLSDLRRVLAPHGTLVSVGDADTGNWLGPVVGVLKPVVVSPFVGQQLLGLLASINQPDLETIADLLARGEVTPVIDRTFPLARLPEAIVYLEQGRTRGKSVIIVAWNGDGATNPISSAPPEDGRPVMSASLRTMLAALVIMVALSAIAAMIAFALNRRFQRNSPRSRPYRWGYFFSIVSAVVGICLGFLLESGPLVAIACGVLYAALAWFFGRRRRWAWVMLTILTLNPLLWIVNLVYLGRRWNENSATARP